MLAYAVEVGAEFDENLGGNAFAFADQAEQDVLGLRLATVYGGTSIDRQIKRLRSGVDLVIATPGRLTDLIDRRF